MIIYIAGPITGNPDYKKQFAAAEKSLVKQGHIVWNPAHAPIGLDYDQYFPVCYAMMDSAEAIYFLPGWEASEGAQREYKYAEFRNMQIFIAGENEPPAMKKFKPAKDTLFEQFWAVYPKKIAKPKAILAWNKISADTELLQKILAALESQKRSENWLKDGGQFIPYPATYLNNRRWEDTVETPANSNNSSFDIDELDRLALEKYRRNNG